MKNTKKYTLGVLNLAMVMLLACGSTSSSTVGGESAESPAPTCAREILNKHLLDITNNKKGLEIGGPSATGALIYEHAGSLDNLVSSRSTLWAEHSDMYKFSENKFGKVIINDATALTDILDSSYDFIFASHVLEHIANPIKALLEWFRAVVPGGYIILILPEKSRTFDHRREITSFGRILAQYKNNVTEDDLSSLGEILRLHDLSRDPAAGTFEQFKKRSLKNGENRSLHHFVYNPELLNELSSFVKGNFVYTFTEGTNIWYVFMKKQ